MKEKDFWVRHEFGGDRDTLEAAQNAPRYPFYGVLDNIRSAHNVGSMFRTADGARAAKLYLCGYTPTPPHRHLAKTALNAVEVVPWQHAETTLEALAELRHQGVQLLGVELTDGSSLLWNQPLEFPVALVMGNEKDGLSDEVLGACDVVVHLPMHGLKSSLNVSVAFGLALYELLRRYESEMPET